MSSDFVENAVNFVCNPHPAFMDAQELADYQAKLEPAKLSGDTDVHCPSLSAVREHIGIEAVNHPSHYGGDNPFEVIKVLEAWDLHFHLGNAVKYIARAGKKVGVSERQDLEKSVWYLKREAERRSSAMSFEEVRNGGDNGVGLLYQAIEEVNKRLRELT